MVEVPQDFRDSYIINLFTIVEYRSKIQSQIYVAFIDLAKAFDSISRKALWRIIGTLWYSSQISKGVRESA